MPIKKVNLTTRAAAAAAGKARSTNTARRRLVGVVIAEPSSPSAIPEEDDNDDLSSSRSTVLLSTPPRMFADVNERGDPSPGQSSDAENRLPQSIASSPPMAQSTPKGKQRDMFLLDFPSSAGYTPPKRKDTSAERPRLQDLDTRTLEPTDFGEDIDFEVSQLPSPTPKRRARVSDFVISEEEEGGPSARATAQQPPQNTEWFTITGYEGEFPIYSDPKSPSQQKTPMRTSVEEPDILSETMRPPQSTQLFSEVALLSSGQKRRSSEAEVDSDVESIIRGSPARSKRNRHTKENLAKHITKGSKTKGKGKEQPTTEDISKEQASTKVLRDLLAQRKKPTKNKQDVYQDLYSSVPADASSEDEITAPVSRRGRTAAIAKSKPSYRSKTVTIKPRRRLSIPNMAAKTTKDSWGRSLAPKLTKKPPPKTPTRTYGRKKTPEPVTKPGAGEEDEYSDVTSPESPKDTVELGDGVILPEGKKKLQDLRQKFEQVDKWEMEFEDVSVSSADKEKR